MAIMTQSGRIVKRPAKMTCGMTCGPARRAKAPAPWSAWALGTYSLTDKARTAPGPGKTMDMADHVAAIWADYVITHDGDHLRFQGNTVGNYARVSLPDPDAGEEEMYVMLGSSAGHPVEAFETVAAQWLARGAQAMLDGRGRQK